VFLARALKHSEAELVAALAATGLPVPENPADKTIKTTLGAYVYWLNKDPRGAIWINGDEAPTAHSAQPPGETTANSSAGSSTNPEVTVNPEANPAETTDAAPPSAQLQAPGATAVSSETPAPERSQEPAREQAPEASVPAVETGSAEPAEAPATQPEAAEPMPPVPTPESPVEPEAKQSARKASRPSAGAAALTALRLLLKPNKRGSGVSAETGYLAKTVGQDLQLLLTTLTELGLALPATAEHKPAFVVQAEEIYWLNKNPKDGSVWLNAKAAKSAVKKTGGTAKPRPKKPAAEE
jgi:hypothetical protein